MLQKATWDYFHLEWNRIESWLMFASKKYWDGNRHRIKFCVVTTIVVSVGKATYLSLSKLKISN